MTLPAADPSRITQPLLLVGVGAAGASVISLMQPVLDRLEVDEPGRAIALHLADGEVGIATLADALPALLDHLFTAPRGLNLGLDVVVVGDAGELEPTTAARLGQVVLGCLEHERRGVLETEGASGGRALHLHTFLETPSFLEPGDGRRAAATTVALEQLHAHWGPRSPMDRIHCLPRRGPWGVHAGTDLQPLLACLLESLFLAGVRGSDAVREFLEPRSIHEPRLSLLSGEAVSARPQRVEAYLSDRLVLMGLEQLRERLRSGAGPDHLAELLAETGLGRLLSGNVAETLSQLEEAEPERWRGRLSRWVDERVGPSVGLDRLLTTWESLTAAARLAVERADRLARERALLGSDNAGTITAPTAPRPAAIWRPGALASLLPATLVATGTAAAMVGKPDGTAEFFHFHLLLPSLLGTAALAALGVPWLRRRDRLRSENAAAREARDLARAEALAREPGRLTRGSRHLRDVARQLTLAADWCSWGANALDAAIDRHRARLARLTVATAPRPEQDVVDGLVRTGSRRVHPLLPAESLTRLVRVPDVEAWARRLLEVAWTGEDAVPFADDRPLAAAAAQLPVLETVRTRSAFAWPVEAAALAGPVSALLRDSARATVTPAPVTALDGERPTLPRRRLLLLPPAARQGQHAALDALAAEGWVPVWLHEAAGLACCLDATLAVQTSHLTPAVR